MVNLIGLEFRGGTVLEKTNERDNKSIVYKCKCKHCDNENWKLSARILKHYPPISCGCLNNNIEGCKKHGMSRDRFYKIWNNLKRRKINDILYKDVSVSDDWVDFEPFKNDMYEEYLLACDKFGIKNVSIDRINPNGNYEKSNCRWANKSMQSYNQDFERHKLNNYILAERIEDGYKIITVNTMAFSKLIFNKRQSHIVNICKGNAKRKSERGWKFKYIPKEQYNKFKNEGMDYIISIENNRVSIYTFKIDISENGYKNKKSASEYMESQRQYYIDKNNKIEYGTHREIKDKFKEYTINQIKNDLNRDRKNIVRKLTPEEISIYELNYNTPIHFKE